MMFTMVFPWKEIKETMLFVLVLFLLALLGELMLDIILEWIVL